MQNSSETYPASGAGYPSFSGSQGSKSQCLGVALAVAGGPENRPLPVDRPRLDVAALHAALLAHNSHPFTSEYTLCQCAKCRSIRATLREVDKAAAHEVVRILGLF